MKKPSPMEAAVDAGVLSKRARREGDGWPDGLDAIYQHEKSELEEYLNVPATPELLRKIAQGAKDAKLNAELAPWVAAGARGAGR